MKTRVTVESLTEELDQAANLARANDQAGAMVQAIATKAKLHGLLVDKREMGAPGDFAALTTADEIIAKVRTEAGDVAAQLISDYIAKRTAPDIDQAQTMAEPQGNC